MRGQPRWVRTLFWIGLTALAVLVAVGVTPLRPPPNPGRGDLVLLLFVAVAVAFGSLAHVRAPLGVTVSPLATAVALGVTLTPWRLNDPSGIPSWAALVLAVAVGGLAGGVVGLRWRNRYVDPMHLIGTVAGTWLCAVLYRVVPISGGRPAVQMWDAWADERWRSVLLMMAAAALGLSTELACTVAGVRATGLRNTRRSLLRLLLPVDLAICCAAVAIGAAMEPLGMLALAVMSIPLLLVRVALDEERRVREHRAATIDALSRVTDIAGFTPPGHSERVRALCHEVGRRLRLGDRDLARLDIAARVHDVGQVALTHPLPGGATVEAAPVDQHEIAVIGAELLRSGGLTAQVGQVVAEQAVPFRQVREFGENVPLSSRIIKVCNAYDDLTGGRPEAHDAAAERLTLGLGYEYDPEVVETLLEVTRPTPPHEDETSFMRRADRRRMAGRRRR